MKSTFLFIVLVFSSLFINAQSSMNDNVKDKKVAATMSLNQRFSVKVLNAYQENSKSKVEDLFSYFQMLTDATLNDELKKEVVKNINLLFQNPNTIVMDFTLDSFDKIPLQQFIQKLLISEPILLSISDETKFDSVDYQSWKTSYIVTKTQNNIVSKINVNQIVFFTESNKKFGSNSKLVYQMCVGEMN